MILPRQFKLKSSSIVLAVSLIILFISSWAPFMEGSPLGTASFRSIFNYLQWLLAATGILLTRKVKSFSSLEVTALVSVLIYRAYNIFHAFNYKGIGLTTIFLGIYFCYISDDIRAKVFKAFKFLMVAASVYGIICFASYFIHLGIPYTVVPRGDGVEWINYRFCYLMNQYNTMIRFCGFFEEPGWFGTWAAFYLCADGLNFKKKENIILLIAGSLTLSLAFFLLLIAYYFLKNLTEWKKWIWVVLLVALYLLVLPNVHTGNYAIDRVLERMVITNEGLVGDNRYGSLFERVWEQTIQSGKIYFGYGAGYAEYYGTGEGQGLASIKSYIVNFGIIGTIIIYIPILIASVRQALRNGNREMLLYIAISYISLYQRPCLFLTPYFIMFMCGISYIATKDQTDKALQFNEIAGTVRPIHRVSLTIRR